VSTEPEHAEIEPDEERCPDGSTPEEGQPCAIDPGDRIIIRQNLSPSAITLTLLRIESMEPDLTPAHASGKCPTVNSATSDGWIAWCLADAVIGAVPPGVAVTTSEAVVAVGSVVNPVDPLVIHPQLVNPQPPGADGLVLEYGWNALPGACYAVEAQVTQNGVTGTFYSPIVGIALGVPPVDDLHLDLLGFPAHIVWQSYNNPASAPPACLMP